MREIVPFILYIVGSACFAAGSVMCILNILSRR